MRIFIWREYVAGQTTTHCINFIRIIPHNVFAHGDIWETRRLVPVTPADPQTPLVPHPSSISVSRYEFLIVHSVVRQLTVDRWYNPESVPPQRKLVSTTVIKGLVIYLGSERWLYQRYSRVQLLLISYLSVGQVWPELSVDHTIGSIYRQVRVVIPNVMNLVKYLNKVVDCSVWMTWSS